MPTLTKVLIIIAIVMVAVLILLYFLGKRAQKKKETQDAQIAEAAQSITMLVIDKKKLKLKESGLPAAVIAQTPKLMRRSKLPIVKAKVGPKVMSFICEASIYDIIPLKKEVKATVSGLYITDVKGIRGGIDTSKPKKKSFTQKLKDKAASYESEAGNSKSKKKK